VLSDVLSQDRVQRSIQIEVELVNGEGMEMHIETDNATLTRARFPETGTVGRNDVLFLRSGSFIARRVLPF
jgi:hypothetical protein